MSNEKYFISEFKDGTITVKEQITKDEVERLTTITVNLKYFSMSKNYMEIAIENGLELNKYYNRISKLNTINEINREKSNNIGTTINRLLLNYLVSFRLFVDNLQRRYAPNVFNGSKFIKEVLNRIYDTEPEYAFLYQLRNYVTHVSIAFDGITFSENKINLICHKEHLLTTYNEWKKENKKYLASLPDNIDIMKMVEKNNVLIMSIYLSFIGYIAPEIQEVHNNVINVIKKYKIMNPLIYVCEDERNLTNGHVLQLGLDVLQNATNELSKVPNVKVNYITDDEIMNSQ